MKRMLITGASGFVGAWLAEYLLAKNLHVSGFDLRPGKLAIECYHGEITDRLTVEDVLRKTNPDVIFHLAGMIKSHQPDLLYQVNLLGTVALFDSIIRTELRPIVVVAGSSAVYGSGFGGRRISEKFKPRPVTHYAVSKLAQEIVALRHFDAFELPVMIVRMFNLLGPGQSPDLACSAFARQIALAEVHNKNEIVTGDLSASRDFVDVRDAVRAFAMVAEKGRPGQVYNVCSGRAVSMRECLGGMLSLSPRQFNVRVDAERVQKNDVPVQVGDARKLEQASGWRPQVKLRQSLSDLLNDWRQKVKMELE
jgi:GDP-4-dehydro-6-deoxy-D-mannose reductase